MAWSAESIDLAKRILSNQVHLVDGCLDEPTVMYDVMWGDPPSFINIKIRDASPGDGLGTVAMLHFLNYFDPGEAFLSTDFTEAGQALLARMQSLGMIQNIAPPQGFQRLTTWRVMKPAQPLLQQIAAQQPPAQQMVGDERNRRLTKKYLDRIRWR